MKEQKKAEDAFSVKLANSKRSNVSVVQEARPSSRENERKGLCAVTFRSKEAAFCRARQGSARAQFEAKQREDLLDIQRCPVLLAEASLENTNITERSQPLRPSLGGPVLLFLGQSPFVPFALCVSDSERQICGI